MSSQRTWQFAIDVGGTFTDCIGVSPAGDERTLKLLSSGAIKLRVAPDGPYKVRIVQSPKMPRGLLKGRRLLGRDTARVSGDDGATLTFVAPHGLTSEATVELLGDEPAPVVGIRWLMGLAADDEIGAVQVRLGTTRGTNALLERRGAKTALVTTAGFADLLAIGYQNRPQLFALAIVKAAPLHQTVVEASERIAADGQVLKPLDEATLLVALKELRQNGVEALAVCLLNSYRNPAHERVVARLAAPLGFRQVSLSSEISALQRIVPRGDTTVVDAYLGPVIREYVASLTRALPQATIKLMTSAGGLADASTFSGKDSVLSGPAGGVVGVAALAKRLGMTPAIGFDMGGTSTDVCRFDSSFERRHEVVIAEHGSDAGVRLATPMLAIETVAAGGGSVCGFDGTRLTVGPASAGADPGPACYGRGGPLTITDCNLVLGRVAAGDFDFLLDEAAARARLAELTAHVNAASGRSHTPTELALGWLSVAVSNMAVPIRRLSLARGFDLRTHTLVSFGGAGPQHACQLADALGIRKVLHHPLASFLSAYGIGMADVVKLTAKDIGKPLVAALHDGAITTAVDAMRQELTALLAREHLPKGVKVTEVVTLDLRYVGQDAVIHIETPADGDWQAAFAAAHTRLYGFAFKERAIEVRAARLELTAVTAKSERVPIKSGPAAMMPPRQVHFSDQSSATPVWRRTAMPGPVDGPALITDVGTTIVIDPGWRARPDRDMVVIERLAPSAPSGMTASASSPDPIDLALFANQFTAIAEEMGAALRRTALSVNVKERLDFSCAIFSPDGSLVVNAPHIPVHLGSMGDTVRAVVAEAGATMRPGDVFVTNDPYRGGSHLPDVTVITPVHDSAGRLVFFTGSRAHHAEIGGITPGSMPPHSKNLGEEGVLIRCFKLGRGNTADVAGLRALLGSGAYPSRAVDDNVADINAQIAAGETGRQRLIELADKHGLATVQTYMGYLRDATRTRLMRALRRLKPGTYRFDDAMDDGTKIAVVATVTHGARDDASVHFDFSGCGPVHAGNLNANRAIVRAAVLYVLRCLIDEDIPLNDGVMAAVTIDVRAGSILNPPGGDDPNQLAAVVGGNVETSQRVVDVLLGAFGMAAASQGTMNNFIFGRQATAGKPGFGYYETIAGGAGAGPSFAGADAVHTHMTNTRITDPEVLEDRFPVRVRGFGIRRGSGGAGAWRGGDGIVRTIEFLAPATVSLLTSRRASRPFGLQGGEPGMAGENRLTRVGGNTESLPGIAQFEVGAGDVVTLSTPGGGGYGSPLK